MVVTVSPENFSEWAALAHLVREAFEYMDGRIDPPSSLGAMAVADGQGRRRLTHQPFRASVTQ